MLSFCYSYTQRAGLLDERIGWILGFFGLATFPLTFPYLTVDLAITGFSGKTEESSHIIPQMGKIGIEISPKTW